MYYKTKHEAQLMKFYHGVKCGSPHPYIDNFYYIKPESHHIFEPQDGDKNIDGYVFDAVKQRWDSGTWSRPAPHELPISERNGKAFIMPERE